VVRRGRDGGQWRGDAGVGEGNYSPFGGKGPIFNGEPSRRLSRW